MMKLSVVECKATFGSSFEQEFVNAFFEIMTELFLANIKIVWHLDIGFTTIEFAVVPPKLAPSLAVVFTNTQFVVSEERRTQLLEVICREREIPPFFVCETVENAP
jgi:hypothetical protein